MTSTIYRLLYCLFHKSQLSNSIFCVMCPASSSHRRWLLHQRYICALVRVYWHSHYTHFQVQVQVPITLIFKFKFKFKFRWYFPSNRCWIFTLHECFHKRQIKNQFVLYHPLEGRAFRWTKRIGDMVHLHKALDFALNYCHFINT